VAQETCFRPLGPVGTGNKAYVFWDGVTSQHFQVMLSRLAKTVVGGHVITFPLVDGSMSMHVLKSLML